jgi:hypothetical protein
MTPKEKAEDLIDLYVRDGYDLVMSEEMAKRCALIAVDLILSEFYADEFYIEVKQEITKL